MSAQLRASLASVEEWIDDHVRNEITRPYKDCKYIGKKLWGLHTFYRTRALLKYLLEGDADAFFADLTREALTHVTFLSAYRAGLDVPESRIDGSTFLPLTSALAAANFELAAEIDELMPRQTGENDGDEPFAFTSMLRALAGGKEQAVEAAHRALIAACEGVDNYDSIIQLTKGIKDGNAKLFNDGLAEYLASIENPSDDEAEELDPGEDAISVEALAFIQLAKRRNIPTRVRHRMIPPELQNADPVVPADGYPGWPG